MSIDDQDPVRALAKEAWLAYRLAFEAMCEAQTEGDTDAVRRANFSRIDADTALRLVRGATPADVEEASLSAVFEPPASLPISELHRRIGRGRALLDALLRFPAEANGDAVTQLRLRVDALEAELAQRAGSGDRSG